MIGESDMSTDPKSSRSQLWLISLCFLLSGYAALLYETVWLRQFAIVLGTSEQALAIILASYMGGLAFGAWLASRWVGEIRRPVWTYGILELGIAACALLMPWGLGLVEHLQVLLFGGSPQPPAAGSFSQVMFGLLACFGLILFPTAMMGATLPLLAKHVIHRDREIGPRVGMLYGINTFGAVAGTLSAAFLFLPQFGLQWTTFIGAAVNGLVFLVIFIAAGKAQSEKPETGVLEKEGEDSRQVEVSSDSSSDASDSTNQAGLVDVMDRHYRRILWFAALGGAVAFCYEIIFTRMLSHLLGGSIFAFATMLAGFLLGIALGGALASRIAIRRDRSAVALVYAQCFAGISALMAYRFVDVVAGWSLEQWGGASATFTQVVISILVLLPTATCIGATFPLATRIFARDRSEAASASARVYLWNTVGGILGALFAGIILLPGLGYQGAVFMAVAINGVTAVAIVIWMKIPFLHIASGCLTFAILVVFAPGRPDQVLRSSALDGNSIQGDLIFESVGRSGTVVLFDQLGGIRFYTNGLPEAIVEQRGIQDPFASSGVWLSALPPLLRTECETMLIIGLGGGVAASHVPASIKEIDVFELEPAVVEANEFIRDLRNRDPLEDPRVKIILNDGRNGLALTGKTYDVIVSQPSHPWTAGASHLYTREFAQTVKQRLDPGGIFLQWMNTDFISVDLFRSLAATLLDVFPHVRVYEPFPGNLLFTASDQPIRPESVTEPRLDIDQRDVSFYREFGIETPTHLFMKLRVDEPELRSIAEGVAVITDEFNTLAMRSPGLLRIRDASELNSFLDAIAPFKKSTDELIAACPTIDPLTVGIWSLIGDRQVDLENAFMTASNPSDRMLYDALAAKADGRIEDCVALLKSVSDAHQDDPRSAFLLLAYQKLGSFPKEVVSEEEAEALMRRLDPRYQELWQAVQAIVINDLAKVRECEPTMASFGIDEIGYELAVRMRVLWRIADNGPQRRIYNREALQLISNAMPLIGSDALIPFRVAAAIGAQNPDIAIASSVDYARSAVDRIKQRKVTKVQQLETLRSNLIKCRSLFPEIGSLPGLNDEQYRNAIQYLDQVIAGNL